jgi:hypothetical protein
LVYFSRFGMSHPGKSGNPTANQFQTTDLG